MGAVRRLVGWLDAVGRLSRHGGGEEGERSRGRGGCRTEGDAYREAVSVWAESVRGFAGAICSYV